MCESRSALVTLPAGPLPLTIEISIPANLALCLTAGLASVFPPEGVRTGAGAAGAGAAGAGAAGAGAGAGAAAKAGGCAGECRPN